MTNLKQIIIAGLLGGIVTFWTSCMTDHWSGKEIYNGKIGTKEILYHEGRSSGGNRMRINSGDIYFYLYDKEGHTFVNENKGDNDKLEYVVIYDENGNKELYRASTEEKNTLYSEHTAKVFEKCNRLYNETRSEIREKIKEKYQSIEQKISQ